MIQKDFLQEILKQQKESVSVKDAGMLRDRLDTINVVPGFKFLK